MYQLRQYVRTSLNTLPYHLDGIYLSLEFPYTNGPIGELNNHIKNIKRSGYGYRNFYNLRARILLVNRLFKNKKTDKKREYQLFLGNGEGSDRLWGPLSPNLCRRKLFFCLLAS
ncbi:transposase [Aerococcaceae bacterium zg-BR9]|uniref:transposase n=1 Tax=Aerococcaceae bacterium zg-1292 TaxID=2774330 RepID=UPI0040631704|nr:transposase [Aerococcaceae bacterium zg-BR9]